MSNIKDLSNEAELNIANYCTRWVISNEAEGRVRYHLNECNNLQYSTMPSSISVLSCTKSLSTVYNSLLSLNSQTATFFISKQLLKTFQKKYSNSKWSILSTVITKQYNKTEIYFGHKKTSLSKQYNKTEKH